MKASELDVIARLICDFMGWPESGPAWDDANKLAHQVHEPAYRAGWNDREADLIAGVRRIAPQAEARSESSVEPDYEAGFDWKAAWYALDHDAAQSRSKAVALEKALRDLVRVAERVDRIHAPREMFGALAEAKQLLRAPTPAEARSDQAGWRPIETAEPEDGKCILVATADTPPAVGEAWWRLDYEDKLDLWWANTSAGDYYADPISERNGRVTHWMPLPTPPKAEGE